MSEKRRGAAGRKPVNPYLVLAAAIMLPGSGHIWLGLTQRAMSFLFFMIILGWLTSKAAPADASFIGRHAGGFLVYAVSLLDAYRIARLRYAAWRQHAG